MHKKREILFFEKIQALGSSKCIDDCRAHSVGQENIQRHLMKARGTAESDLCSRRVDEADFAVTWSHLSSSETARKRLEQRF
jgi:hypothetical protein